MKQNKTNKSTTVNRRKFLDIVSLVFFFFFCSFDMSNKNLNNYFFSFCMFLFSVTLVTCSFSTILNPGNPSSEHVFEVSPIRFWFRVKKNILVLKSGFQSIVIKHDLNVFFLLCISIEYDVNLYL